MRSSPTTRGIVIDYLLWNFFDWIACLFAFSTVSGRLARGGGLFRVFPADSGAGTSKYIAVISVEDINAMESVFGGKNITEEVALLSRIIMEAIVTRRRDVVKSAVQTPSGGMK